MPFSYLCINPTVVGGVVVRTGEIVQTVMALAPSESQGLLLIESGEIKEKMKPRPIPKKWDVWGPLNH